MSGKFKFMGRKKLVSQFAVTLSNVGCIICVLQKILMRKDVS